MSPPKKVHLPTKIVSTAAMANSLNLTTRHTNALAADGILPRLGRDRWDVVAALSAYIVYAHRVLGAGSALDGKGTVSAPSALHHSRMRLQEVQLQRKQLALHQELAAVISTADHAAIIADMAHEARRETMAIAPRAARALVRLGPDLSRSAIAEAIKTEVLVALAALAHRVPRLPSAARTRALARTPVAAPTSKSKSKSSTSKPSKAPKKSPHPRTRRATSAPAPANAARATPENTKSRALGRKTRPVVGELHETHGTHGDNDGQSRAR
jgi:hypothetical protein